MQAFRFQKKSNQEGSARALTSIAGKEKAAFVSQPVNLVQSSTSEQQASASQREPATPRSHDASRLPPDGYATGTVEIVSESLPIQARCSSRGQHAVPHALEQWGCL